MEKLKKKGPMMMKLMEIKKEKLKKRKKRRRVICFKFNSHILEKKKATGGESSANGTKLDKREQDNSLIRKLGNWKAGDYKQTTPPTIPVS